MPIGSTRTRWGGIADGYFQPTGFFHVGRNGNVFWLVDPDGGRFISKGINTVRFDQDQIRDSDRVPYAEACRRKYGNENGWRAAAARRLLRWGFNTLGSWSDEAVAATGSMPLATTPNLDLGMSFARQKNDQNQGEPQQHFPDVFDPEFDLHIRHRAHDLCANRRNDQSLVGWFIDNELRWGPDWRGPDDLLTLFLNLTPGSPGRAQAINFLRGRHGIFEHFNSSWRSPAQSWDELTALPRVEPPYRRKPPYERDAGSEDAANRADLKRSAFTADCDDFAALVAERYFASTTTAIKAADANHLVLGCRFAYPPSPFIIDAAGCHADVISFNCYENDASAAIDTYAITGKPCLIGEFSFRAADSGLPNTSGAGPRVATQAERAICFGHYVTSALQKRTLIGYHWFEHADQPAEGRFDGENSNFGTVTIEDHVYEELTNTMTSINAEAEDLHVTAA